MFSYWILSHANKYLNMILQTFLGNRYGFRPIPRIIQKEEFETLLKIAEEENLNIIEIKEWYRLDENAIPAVYELQPISSKLKYFIDMNPYNQQKRKQDKETWWRISNNIKKSFEKAANIGLHREVLQEGAARKYLISG